MNNSPDPLETFIHQTLRSLPERRAPRTLESRVMAAIEARITSPWWKRSYADWPLAARIVFLVVSGAIAKLAIMTAVWVMSGSQAAELSQAVAAPLAWVDLLKHGLFGARDLCAVVFRSIPPLWVYGGLAVFASIYVTLFGIGATAYRTLYAKS